MQGLGRRVAAVGALVVGLLGAAPLSAGANADDAVNVGYCAWTIDDYGCSFTATPGAFIVVTWAGESRPSVGGVYPTARCVPADASAGGTCVYTASSSTITVYASWFSSGVAKAA